MPAEQQRKRRTRFRGELDRVRALFREHPLEPQAEVLDGNILSFEALATQSDIDEARNLGLKVTEVPFEPTSSEPRRDLHTGNRFRDGQVPTGAGKLVRP